MVSRAPSVTIGRTVDERAQVLWLFGMDWSSLAAERFAKTYRIHNAGFDLFSFPSNASFLWFDIERFVERQVRRHGAYLQAALSHEEQFGALSAALIAERLNLPGTNPDAILKLQHKLICREIIEEVAPECNLGFGLLDCELGEQPKISPAYPSFIKPVKASFSVLARRVDNDVQLADLVRFGPLERPVIERLVKPFDDICRKRLNGHVDARRMLVEEHVQADQFNLDGYVFGGKAHLIGIVDEIMYPQTQAFLRFQYPSKLPESVQQRAHALAAKVLAKAGFDHGFFNMEFFYDHASDKMQVVEFNPRLASQLADLYERVDGIDVYGMSMALAMGQNPALVPRKAPQGKIAASCALRSFDGTMPARTDQRRKQQVQCQFANSTVMYFAKSRIGRRREYRWMKSNRFGVINLHGSDEQDLNQRYKAICDSLNWPAPF